MTKYFGNKEKNCTLKRKLFLTNVLEPCRKTDAFWHLAVITIENEAEDEAERVSAEMHLSFNVLAMDD